MESPMPYDMNTLANILVERKEDPSDLIGTLKHIAQIARVFFKASACTLFAINPITHHPVASQTEPDSIVEDEVIYDQVQLETLIQRTFARGAFLVSNVDEAPDYPYLLEPISSFLSLPLRVQNSQKPLGLLCLYFKEAPFKTDKTTAIQRLFQTFSLQASFLLQETWLLRRHREVARIGQEINQELSDIATLFEKLQKHASGILDTNHKFLLTMYEPQTNTHTLYLKTQGAPTIRYEHRSLKGAYAYVIKTKKTLFINHLSEEQAQLPFQFDTIADTAHEEAFIYVPLVLRDVPLGVLSLQHTRPGVYDQEDTFILQMLANHIALALYNIRLYSNLRLLNDTGQLLTQHLDHEQTLQATADRILEVTKADVIVLYPYSHIQQSFIPPPVVAGELQHSSSAQLMVPRLPDDIATLLIQQEEPVFASESTTLYTRLTGDIRSRQDDFQHREGVASTAAMRLQVGAELVGVLFINFRQTQAFDGPQRLLIEGLSHFAAIAINNARTVNKFIQRHLRQLEILQKIDRELNRNLELQDVLDTLIKLAATEVVLAEDAAILLYDARTQLLRPEAAVGNSAEVRKSIHIPFVSANGITRWVLQHKEPVRVGNVRRDKPWCDIYISADARIISELDVPLLDGEEMIGVLNFESSVEEAFSEEDENFLSTLAGQVVLAVKKAQAYAVEKRQATERRVLNEISREIIRQFDQEHIFKLILEKALELTDSNMGNLMLYDPVQGDLQVATEHNVAANKEKQRQQLDQGIVGHVARTKQLVNANVTQSPWKDMYLAYFTDVQSELAVPMLQGSEIRGVLNVESSTPDNFDKLDEELLTGLADLAVIALHNAEQYHSARTDAQRFALLYDAGKELSNISEFEQLDQAYDAIVRIAGVKCQGQLILRRYDSEKQASEVIRASSGVTLALSETFHQWVMQTRQTLLLVDIQHLPVEVAAMPPVSPPSESAAGSLLITPILFNERLYGTLEIRHEETHHFSKEDGRFFEGLAQQLAGTIYRIESVQERQELQRRNVALEFMGNIGQSAFSLTHQLENMLGIIPLMVDNIREELDQQGASNDFVAERLGRIRRAAKSVLAWSNKIKSDVSHLRVTEQIDTPTLIYPESLLREALSAIPLPPHPRIEIGMECVSDAAALYVTISSVMDILQNLIENAIKAMPNGGIITLKARNEGRFVALEVIDTGVGIPLDAQPHIFEFFYSTRGSSGFGLWNARRNAFKNGGDIKVESQPGRGTRFTLLLPKAERSMGATP